MTQALATRDPAALMERAVIQGDLSQLSAVERVDYYRLTCESLGLNPYTKPFEYLELDDGKGGKKLVLYTRRDCTDQLRDIKKVSIVRLDRERTEDLYIVTAHAVLPDGRTDSAVGAVPISKQGGYWQDVVDRDGRPVLGDNNKPKRRFVTDGTYVSLTGDALANAIMKAETKAKRRVTLSICGLGMTDESEIDSIPGAMRVDADYPTPSGQSSIVEVVSSADNRVWKRWLEVLAEAQGLGVQLEQIRLPIPLEELKRRGAEAFEAIQARKAQLAEQDAAAAAGKLEHDRPSAAADSESPAESKPTRDELWAENRRLVDEAQKRGIQGPTLNGRTGKDALVSANAELAQRIETHDLDQIAAQQSQVPF